MKRIIPALLAIFLVTLTGCTPDITKFIAFDNAFVNIPLWVIYLGTLIIILGCIWFGHWYAHYRKRKYEGKDESSLSQVISGLMGLLAFILAFTFGLSNSRFNDRKELMLQEVNAIETAYLRAGLLPEPYKSNLRNLIDQYVTTRLSIYHKVVSVNESIKASEILRKKIWDQINLLQDVPLRAPVVFSLLLGSVNDMFNLHVKRVTVGTIYHLPAVLWIALYMLVIFTMIGVGFMVGQAPRTNILLITIFALGFSSIILVIADLDHGGTKHSGFINISPKPLSDLQQRLGDNP